MSPAVQAIVAIPSTGVLRLGIVLPPSVRYPGMSRELLSGFEAFAASSPAGGLRVSLVPIACGAGARAPLLAAGEAVKRGVVDMLAGMVDPNLAGEMAPLLEMHGVPFVVSDMGADVVRKRWASPMLARSSLGCWQASSAMGQWAPAHLGRRALVVADFLESGYDMVYAFRQAFEAGGGEIVDLRVTGMPDASGTFADVKRAIEAHRPDFVFAFFSGHRAERFVRFYDREGLARVASLAGTGLLTHAGSSRASWPGSAGIVTAACWENTAASPFTTLGHATAQRIAAGLGRQGGEPRDEMGETPLPVFMRRVTASNGRLVDTTIARLPPVALPDDACCEMRGMIKTGWAQAYLAA
jgi:branched-chain amino acid transport system substrate-binding protein